MTKRGSLLGSTMLCALLWASGASAQPAPFDMAPEGASGAGQSEPPRTATPPSASPSSTSSPSGTPGQGRAPAFDAGPAAATPPVRATSTPVAPSNTASPAPQAPRATSASTESPPSPGASPADRRYILPMERLTLAGEIAQRRWTIFLTEDEAAAARSITIAYLNSILVAPEASQLRLSVNGQVMIETPVQAVNEPAPIVVDMPDGLLRAGLNTIAFETALRHRTDCSVQSTYDLWTEIEGAESFITLDSAVAGVGDVRAVGSDAQGRTRYDIVVPSGGLQQASVAGMRLSQGLALLGGMPNTSIDVREGTLGEAGPGAMTIIAGPAEDIADLVPGLGVGASRAAYAEFETLPDGRRALVLSGPTWSAVEQAAETIVAPVDRSTTLVRSALSEPGWRSPDAPLLFSAASLPFRDLGVASEEFSGRLFRTSFVVGVPADFYAEAYGEATILLDAAYSADVLPGSHLDVYVNADLATTIPIGAGNGAVLRQFPVPVTLRHFRPGVNIVTVEAVLETAADAACLPGTSTGTTTRFALFDSSTFEMPSFARVSRRPDLSGLSGTGYPYNRVDDAIPLYLAESSAETLSAAASIGARLAISGGRPFHFEAVTPASAAGRDAIFVGTASRMATGVLAQVGVSDLARTSWGVRDTAVAAAPASGVSIENWEAQVGDSWGPLVSLENWLSQRFDLTADALRLSPSAEPPYQPSADVPFFVAQGRDPEGDHTWTVVTARTGEELADGARQLVREENWRDLAGRLTAYDSAQSVYIAMPANDARLVPSVAFSLTNLRLIAANFLSSHALAYALILAFASILLGVATGALTGRLGRGR